MCSHPGHYPVDPCTSAWSPKGPGHCHEWSTPIPFNLTFKIQGQGHGQGQPNGHTWGLEFNRYVCFSFHGNRIINVWDLANSYLTLKIQGQCHSQGQTRWSHLRPRVHTICLIFVLWQSDHFCMCYSKFHIWPGQFKFKFMTKINQNIIL